jgi:hypothetical protein
MTAPIEIHGDHQWRVEAEVKAKPSLQPVARHPPYQHLDGVSMVAHVSDVPTCSVPIEHVADLQLSDRQYPLFQPPTMPCVVSLHDERVSRMVLDNPCSYARTRCSEVATRPTGARTTDASTPVPRAAE